MLARRILGLNKRLVANRLANGFPTGMAYPGAVQGDAVALQDNPDYNLEYVDALFDPLPPRPLMMGVHNTGLAALREREQGNWGDLSADEQVKFVIRFHKLNSFRSNCTAHSSRTHSQKCCNQLTNGRVFLVWLLLFLLAAFKLSNTLS